MLKLLLVLFWLIWVFSGLFYFLSRISDRCAETFPGTTLVDFGFFGLVLFERSEFLIDTSQKKNPSACARVPRARVHVCNNLGISTVSYTHLTLPTKA